VTADGLPSAHFEHTIVITLGGADILTEGDES
jgi:methionine aminopeptidase